MEPSQSETQYGGGEVSTTTVHCLWKVSGNGVYRPIAVGVVITSRFDISMIAASLGYHIKQMCAVYM